MERYIRRGQEILQDHPRHVIVTLSHDSDVQADWFAAATPGRPTIVFYGDLACIGGSQPAFAATAGGAISHGLNVALIHGNRRPRQSVRRHEVKMRSALGRLSDFATTHGAAPSDLYVVGHGGGAWLAGRCLDMAEVAAGISVSGCCSAGLRHQDLHHPPPVMPLPRMAGPLLIVFGCAEPRGVRQEMRAFHQRWQDAGLASWLVGLPGRNHFDILGELVEPDGWLTKALLMLIDGDLDGALGAAAQL